MSRIRAVKSRRLTSPPHRRQGGAALIIALILLLVLTILGVTAMNSSLLQRLMSGGFQQQARTLASAENTLRLGEIDVEQLVIFGVDSNPQRSNYYYNVTIGDLFDAANLPAWPKMAGGAFYPFVIEYLGQRLVPGESVAVGGGFEDSLVHVFRVSAIESRPSGERGGRRIVQSLYLTLDGPDQ